MFKKQNIPFSTVSEWLAAGGVDLKLCLLEDPVKETEKAVAFHCTRYTAAANSYKGIGWLPKSLIKEIKNDFYEEGMGKRMWLAPLGLLQAKKGEGFDFFDVVEW